jgi:hypothetical protein
VQRVRREDTSNPWLLAVTVGQPRRRGEDLENGFSGSRWHIQLGQVRATIAKLREVAIHAILNDNGKPRSFWLVVAAP